MYYIDQEDEKCSLETQGDLESVYSIALRSNPPNLKIILDIKRGIHMNKSNKRKRVVKSYKNEKNSR